MGHLQCNNDRLSTRLRQRSDNLTHSICHNLYDQTALPTDSLNG